MLDSSAAALLGSNFTIKEKVMVDSHNTQVAILRQGKLCYDFMREFQKYERNLGPKITLEGRGIVDGAKSVAGWAKLLVAQKLLRRGFSISCIL